MKPEAVEFPPSSFDKLRQIVMLLSHNKLDLSIGKRSFKALQQMVDEPQIVASHNIKEVARRINISPPSLTRLARLLGFTHYNQFRNIFRNQYSDTERFYSSLARNLVDQDKMNLVQNQAEAVCQNIQSTLRYLTDDAISRSLEIITRERQIYVMGLRQSFSLANMFSYGLSMIRPGVQQVATNGFGLAMSLSQLKRGDGLVVFGSAPYSRETTIFMKQIAKLNLPVIAITDSETSPLAERATVPLIVPTNSHYFSNSFVACTFLCESLLTLAAHKLGQTAVKNLEQREEFIQRINNAF